VFLGESRTGRVTSSLRNSVWLTEGMAQSYSQSNPLPLNQRVLLRLLQDPPDLRVAASARSLPRRQVCIRYIRVCVIYIRVFVCGGCVISYNPIWGGCPSRVNRIRVDVNLGLIVTCHNWISISYLRYPGITTNTITPRTNSNKQYMYNKLHTYI